MKLSTNSQILSVGTWKEGVITNIDKQRISSQALWKGNNIKFNEDGSVKTRDGYISHITGLDGPIFGLFEYKRIAGDLMVIFAGTKMYSSEGDGTTTEEKTGLSQYFEWSGLSFEDLFYCGNGNDDNIVFDGTNVRTMGFPAPTGTITAAVGTATGLTGTYTYQCTFVYGTATRTYGESNGNAVSGSVTVTNEKIDLSNIPVGTAGAYVIARKIYRKKDSTDAQYHYVTTINDNVTTTFTDTGVDPLDDTTVLLNETIPDNHDVPPKMYLMALKDGVIFGVSPSDPYTVVYSDLFSSVENMPILNIKSIPSRTRATALIYYNNEIIVGTDDEIFAIGGNTPDNIYMRQISSAYGVLSKKAVIIKDNFLYFPSKRGWCRTDGYRIQVISERIFPDYDGLNFNFADLYAIIDSTQSQWEAGSYGTDVIDTTNPTGSLTSKFYTSKTDWEGGTVVDLDTTTTPGDVVLNIEEVVGTIFDPTPAGSPRGLSTIQTFMAQSFKITNTAFGITKVVVPLSKKSPLITNSVYCEIRTDNSGEPSGTILATKIISAGDIPVYPAKADTTFEFASLVDLDSDTTYWIVIHHIQTGGILYVYGVNTDQYSNGEAKESTDSGSSWNTVGSFKDMEFAVYKKQYKYTGNITTTTLDLVETPASLGYLKIDATVPNNTTITVYGETLAADAGWTVNTLIGTINPGGSGLFALTALGTPQQYVRIKLVFAQTDLVSTPTLSALTIGGVYVSTVKDFSVNNLEWGNVELTHTLNSGEVKLYLRSGPTATPDGSWTAWTETTIGSIPSITVNRYGQYKLEFSRKSTSSPQLDQLAWFYLQSKVGSTVSKFKMASIFFNDNLWLMAATAGNFNPSKLIQFDKFDRFSFFTGWDFSWFFIFKDVLYAGSSTDGSIYEMYNGNSDAGTYIELDIETADMDFGMLNWKSFLSSYISGKSDGNYTLKVTPIIDGEKARYVTVNLYSTEEIDKLVTISNQGKHLRFNIYDKVLNHVHQINKLEVEVLPINFRGF